MRFESTRARLAATALVLSSTAGAASAHVFGQQGLTPIIRGPDRQNHELQIIFQGPNRSEGGAQNPFRDCRMQVTFTHATAGTFLVEGHFLASLNPANDSATSGNYWRACFTPPLPGNYNYSVSFVKGTNVAVYDFDLANPYPAGTPHAGLHGSSGTISIDPLLPVAVPDPEPPGCRDGRLVLPAGKTHRIFETSGRPWFKLGVGSPENMLAGQDFDNTQHLGGGMFSDFSAHIVDWISGDPVWQTSKGKGHIGMLNYLHDQGVNSIYFLTFAGGGDSDDVWPWTSPTAYLTYDVSKLDQWNVFFRHASQKGIHLNFMLSQNENYGDLGETDANSELTIERKIYLRELVSRFGHHLALTWDLGEENKNTPLTRQRTATYIRRLDPYDSPIKMHTFACPNDYDEGYTGLLGYPDFDGADFQIHVPGFCDPNPGPQAWPHLRSWRRQSIAASHPWEMTIDELAPGARSDGNNHAQAENNRDRQRGVGLWYNLLSGGSGLSVYFASFGDTCGQGCCFPNCCEINCCSDLGCNDISSRELMYAHLRHMNDFVQNVPLPLDDMTPRDPDPLDGAALLSGYTGSGAHGPAALSFRQGEVYVIYLPDPGTVNLDLSGESASSSFTVDWFDPNAGGSLVAGTVPPVPGGGAVPVALGNPASGAFAEDRVIVVRKL